MFIVSHATTGSRFNTQFGQLDSKQYLNKFYFCNSVYFIPERKKVNQGVVSLQDYFIKFLTYIIQMNIVESVTRYKKRVIRDEVC